MTDNSPLDMTMAIEWFEHQGTKFLSGAGQARRKFEYNYL